MTPDGWDFGAPRFRPDGSALCFTVADAPTRRSTADRASAAHRGRASTLAAPAVVTKDLDRAVGSWAFTPDSKTLYFTAEDAGHERIYVDTAVRRRGEARRSMRRRASSPASRFPRRRRRRRCSPTGKARSNPAEIVRIDPASGERKFLTSFNTAKARTIDWQPLREFWFTGRDGRRIHSFVALPPNFDETKKYPLFVLIHGGHANMWRDSITYRWNYHLLAQPGFVVLLTDYRGSTGYGEKFTLDILGDPLAGPADDINDAADEAIKRFPFIDGIAPGRGRRELRRPPRQLAGGHDHALQGLVSHAGLATLEMQWGTSDGIYHRELMMGGPYWEKRAELDRAEPARQGRQFQDADARCPSARTTSACPRATRWRCTRRCSGCTCRRGCWSGRTRTTGS